MLKRFPLFAALVILTFFAASRDSRAQSPIPAVPTGEVVYVSSGTYQSVGGQILKIDATGTIPGVTLVSNGPSCVESPCFEPEGMVVGPDGKIYAADPVQGTIFRLDQSGAHVETIYTVPSDCSSESSLPCAPQSPAFSGTTARDLYFGDPSGFSDPTDDVFMIGGAGNVPTGGSFGSHPPTIVFTNCTEGYYCSLGQGLAFDADDDLVFNDLDGFIWTSPPQNGLPTYNSMSSSNSHVGAGGIALNKATGQMFVVSGQSIMQVGSGTPYYTFTGEPADLPGYMAFDATGHLFVVTTNPDESGNMNGKVWRIEPGGGTAVELADLHALYTGGGSGLTSDNASGVALPATQGETMTTSITSSAAGMFTFGWPKDCAFAYDNTNTCEYSFGITYPAGTFPTCSPGDPCKILVTPMETSEADWALRTLGGPYSGTQIAPVAGENGDGIIFAASCTQSGSPCPVPANPGSVVYTPQTTWKSSQIDYCSSNPLLLKSEFADPNNWMNTLAECDTLIPFPTYGTKGKTTCTSSSCLSFWANTFNIVANYTFVGFQSPVSNLPDLNSAKAGQTIPVKFQVLGSGGTPVLNLNMPPVAITFTPTGTCSGTPTTLTTSDASGNSGFQNLGNGNYQFNWKTLKSMAGSCGVLQVTIGDLVLTHTANFQFK